jgi:asparagine synthase (glutamine-hydrolysing)
MCGLFASITQKEINHQRVLETLQRRGPDGQGHLHKEVTVSEEKRALNLIHTRLSIVDLDQQSNQPFHSHDKRYSLIFNGEIYNYIELKKVLISQGLQFRTQSDTEVLLASYIFWGESCLEKLRGIFSFCIWDHRDESLFIARDHLGVKPLYILNHGKEFALSSTIEALLASNLVTNKNINEKALDHFLAYGSFDGEHTLIDQIKMFPPAHFGVYKNDHLKVDRYWQMELPEQQPGHTYEDAVKHIRQLMLETTEYQMRADVDVGAFLSGGIDSGLLVALMSRYTDKPLHTYSIGFEDNQELLEWDLAKLSAKKYQTKHHEIKITEDTFLNSLDEFIHAIDHPTVDGLNSFFVAKETGKDLKVAISGLGGDEAFAGYFFYPKIYQASKAIAPLKQISNIMPNQLRRKGKFSFLKYSTNHLESILNEHRIIHPAPLKRRVFNPLPIKENYYLSSTSIHELLYYTPNTLLRDVDAVSMHSSLEVRVPFLDHKVIEYTLSLPDQYKVSRQYNKPLLIDAFPDALPKEVISAPKRGFEMPVGRWIFKKYQDQLKDLKSGLSFLQINPTLIDQSISQFEKNNDQYRAVWKLIVLYHWSKKFLV